MEKFVIWYSESSSCFNTDGKTSDIAEILEFNSLEEAENYAMDCDFENLKYHAKPYEGNEEAMAKTIPEQDVLTKEEIEEQVKLANEIIAEIIAEEAASQEGNQSRSL